MGFFIFSHPLLLRLDCKSKWNENLGKFLSETGKELPRSLRGKQLIEDALKKAQDLINSGWGN